MYDALPREREMYSSKRYECHYPKVVRVEHDTVKGRLEYGPLCYERNKEWDCTDRQTWWQKLWGINRHKEVDDGNA